MRAFGIKAKQFTDSQVSIPMAVQHILDLDDGDDVLFIVQEDGQVALQRYDNKKWERDNGLNPILGPYDQDEVDWTSGRSGVSY